MPKINQRERERERGTLHQSALGRIKTSLRVHISRQGTPNGVMLLPPEACVFSGYMCVYFYCLKYQVVFLLAFSVTAKNLIKSFFILTSNKNSPLKFRPETLRIPQSHTAEGKPRLRPQAPGYQCQAMKYVIMTQSMYVLFHFSG